MREGCYSPGLFSEERISIKKRLEVFDIGSNYRSKRLMQSAKGEKKIRKNEAGQILYQGVLSRDKVIIERAFVE